MAKAVKSVSILAIFFVFFLVISQVPETEAQDSECLKEYGGDVGFSFCAPRVYPTICYQKCQRDKGAKAGKCIWREGGKVQCLCDFCDNSSFLIKI